MKQLLIYDDPVVLSRARHRHAHLTSPSTGFAFAAALNSVPLTVIEFADAARDYPIVFAGGEDQASMPAVLLGLGQSENLYVQADGSWDAHAYVPAFLRRYPFVVADQPASGQLNVCLERACMSDGTDGIALFDDDGNASPTLDRAMRFLTDYQGAVERTRTVMQELRDNDLLVARSINVAHPDAPVQSLNGFSVIDEPRLQKLSAKALKALARNGTLGLAYVHLASLGNVKRLAQRRDQRWRRRPDDPASITH